MTTYFLPIVGLYSGWALGYWVFELEQLLRRHADRRAKERQA
jgi:hypothetical protein